MKNIKEILIAILLCIISNGYIYCQTLVWDEYYTRTDLYDDFSGSQLDLNKWSVEDDAYLNHTAFIDSSATVNVDGGNLQLTTIWCSNCSVGGYTQIHAAAGKVISKDKFQYGIFESHIHFPRKEGTLAYFLLRGGNGVPCEQGGLYENEIDIANSWWRQLYPFYHLSHKIRHYHTGTNCVEDYEKVDEFPHEYSAPSSYYIFKCIWTPSHIRYYVNDNLVHEIQNTGSKCTGCNKEWFPEYPMHLSFYQILSHDVLLYLEVPQTTYIDYVSVKTFFPTPKITVPDAVCTSAQAVLSTENDASNITWALSPSSLFSGPTTGTGATASMTSAGNIGQGKIIYSFDIGDDEFTAEKTFWVGDPDPDDFYIVGLDNYGSSIGSDNSFEVCENNYYTFYLYPVCNLSENHHRYGITDVDFYFDFDYTIVNEGYGWAYVYVNNIDGNSTGLVDVDACNYLDEFLVYDVDEGYCGRQLLILSPNPASAEVSIAIESDNNTDAGLKSTTTQPTFDQNEEWELEVYNNMQNLKAKKTKIRGISTILNTHSWNEGVYTVRAKYKGEVLTGKLVVKK